MLFRSGEMKRLNAATEKIIYYSQLPLKSACHTGSHGEAQGSSGGRTEGAEANSGALIMVSMGRRGTAGISRFRMGKFE